MSISRGMYIEGVVHIYSGVLLRHKKQWNHAICSTLDGPRDYHTKWSQRDKDKYHGNTHIWNLRKGYKWAYTQYKNGVIDVENKLTVTRE